MDHADKHRSGGSSSVNYDSDDDIVRTSKNSNSFGQHRTKRGHPIYSREDIREQYCINTKELEVFEEAAYAPNRLFGCLSLNHLPDHSPCNKTSILPDCVKRKNSLLDSKGKGFVLFHSCRLFPCRASLLLLVQQQHGRDMLCSNLFPFSMTGSQSFSSSITRQLLIDTLA